MSVIVVTWKVNQKKYSCEITFLRASRYLFHHTSKVHYSIQLLYLYCSFCVKISQCIVCQQDEEFLAYSPQECVALLLKHLAMGQ